MAATRTREERFGAPRVDPLELGPTVRERGSLPGSTLEGTWERPAFDGPPRAAHYVLPDTCTDVIFSIDRDGRIEALVTGPSASFGVFPTRPTTDYVGARVRAGFGRPLLEALREHCDETISIRKTRLPLLPSHAMGKEEARVWLAERLSDLTLESRHAPPTWMAEALRLTATPTDPNGNGATKIAHRVGVSTRTLRRGFLHWVGLSPKRVIRLERAKLAAGLLIAGQSAADAAADLSFSDQAHMIRELRAVLGISPGQLRRGGRVADLFKNLRRP